MERVALGTLDDVDAELKRGASLEERDWWLRTPWLIAILTGDVGKTRLLLKHGADPTAVRRCGKPPLFYAVESHRVDMLEWLLSIGTPVEQTDDFGDSALIEAVEGSDESAVRVLLRAGADVNRENNGTPLSRARTPEIIGLLLDAGADPAHLSGKGQRSILGYPPDADYALLDATEEDFRSGHARRFGTTNPERMDEPFWTAMIHAGISAAESASLLGGRIGDAPIWSAQRFGQSITQLPDGRVVQIGGEHEGYYDRDFCIYNDVFLHAPDRAIQILGYPDAVLPPTDFHTATLIGDYCLIIGGLGYVGSRLYGETPVYRLDLTDFSMKRLYPKGECPGWIYGHRAALRGQEIEVTGGKIVTAAGTSELHAENLRSFWLDTERLVWLVG